MPTKLSRVLLPRLQDILFFCIFSLVLILGRHMLNADGDLPRHLATGKLIMQSGAIPHTEPFIYPYAGRPYVSHEWLADVLLYLTDLYFGLAGIVLLSAILLATAFTLLYSYLSKQVDYRVPVMLLVVWGSMAMIPNWITRPHLFSILFLVIWLISIDRLVEGHKIPLWVFPALMLVWSNLHGEFIAGILVLIAYAVGSTWDSLRHPDGAKPGIGRKLWITLILSVLASFIRPGSGQSWATIFGFLNNRYLTSLIIEAQPPNFQQPTFFLMFGLLLLSILILATKREHLPAGQALLLAGFTAMGLLAARNIHLYAIVAPFVLAKTLALGTEIRFLSKIENTLRHIEENLEGILWPILTTAFFCIFVFSSGISQNYQFDHNSFPVDAVEWLKFHPQAGDMFNDINWGGYIAMQLWPQQPTFIDSIADYTGDVTKEYISVMSLSDTWQAIFAKYGIAWVIVPPHSLLAETLVADPQWKIVYEDNTSIILRH